MAIIILTIYTLLITLLWGVSLGRQIQREKYTAERNLRLAQLSKDLEKPTEIRIDIDAHGLPVILNELAKDMKANLKGTEAVVRAMVDIKDSAVHMVNGKPEDKTPEFYVQQLAYARDHFDLSEGQKRQITAIINKVSKTYGK